jgi:8-oxo-dGTP pyrophosphatase MutT (NUDIX family)
MKQTTRYQGAIIRDDHILLIKHREHATGQSYWIFPGGKRELPETEEACVQQEMLEETHLDVKVGHLLLDDADIPLGSYKRLKTYLCEVISGEAQPGFEPEIEAAQKYAIAEVRWFDLRDSTQWEALLENSLFTLTLLQRIRAILGYSVENIISDGETGATTKAA